MTVDMRVEETFNSPYLGNWDLPEDGSDLVLTIKDVEYEEVTNHKTNQSKKEIILYFTNEKYKPMVLGARVNKDNIKQALGTGRTTGWIGKDIQLYKEPGTWFGKSGFAVRIRPFVSK